MLNRWLAFLVGCLLFVGFSLGCGSDKDKDVNKNKDKPKAADKAE
jgi:hypothetical protein